jgi:hypothetical protein
VDEQPMEADRDSQRGKNVHRQQQPQVGSPDGRSRCESGSKSS